MSQSRYETGRLSPEEQTDAFEDLDAMEESSEDDLREEAAEIQIQATRVEIEQTRAEMSETIDAIREKLSPSHLIQEAKDTVREATVGRAQEAMSNAVDSAKYAVGRAGNTVRDAGSSVVDTIRENPIPSALIALGVGWLWMSARRRAEEERRWSEDYYEEVPESRYAYGPSRGYRDRTYSYATPAPPRLRVERAGGYSSTYEEEGEDRPGVRERVGEAVGRARERVGDAVETVQERVGDVAGTVRERAGDLAEDVRDRARLVGNRTAYQTRRAVDGAQRMMEDNPLMCGAVCLGVGAALGLLIPETDAERRVMGETRDRLVDRAKETAQDIADRAQGVARKAVETVREEVKNQGLVENAA